MRILDTTDQSIKMIIIPDFGSDLIVKKYVLSIDPYLSSGNVA